MKDWLLSGFDYDLWGNMKWLDVIGRFKDRDRAQGVLNHILLAHRVWLDSVDGNASESFEAYESLVADRDRLNQAVLDWKDQLAKKSLDHKFPASRRGMKWEFTLGETARHVLNHGTYHRGHLRGLAHAEGWEDFEDTDWSQWLRETGAVKRLV